MRGNGRILVVDDDGVVRMIIEAFLSKEGYDVICARDGPEALAILADVQGIDVLVTDCVMPEMSGAELALRVRLSYPALPILAVTGYTDLRDAGRMPADVVFLHKPCEREALLRAVRTLIQGAAPRIEHR